MKRSLNLMSEGSRKRGQLRSCLRLWSRILAIVLCVLTVSGLAQWKICHTKKIQQDFAETEYDPIRQLKKENGQLRKQIASIEEAERIPLELAKQQHLLSLIGLASQAVAEQEGNVFLQQIEIERDPLSRLSAGQSIGQPILSFALEGISINRTAITQLAEALRERGPFTAVELSTGQVSYVGKQALQAFSIECTHGP